MEFIDVISNLLSIAGQLVADWPQLVGVAIFSPTVTNLLKYLFSLAGKDFDGSANLVSFALAAVVFNGYFIARVTNFDTGNVDMALVNIAGLITSFLSLVGFQIFSSRVSLPIAKKLPSVLGYSYSK